jgi:hypothetical protein
MPRLEVGLDVEVDVFGPRPRGVHPSQTPVRGDGRRVVTVRLDLGSAV